jgi:site-specific DNA-methyltransferase (adenine-specific)
VLGALLERAEGPEVPIPSELLDRVYCRSSENMEELPARSVHLMVTSPPYNVGKEYDQNLSLSDYRELLKRVLRETYRVLVPGGRACVNVANLGRKPYIPLHAYVIEDASEVGFFMRGEIIWSKGAGAGTSTAWGSWCSPTNPTLRDIHEYILIFQKPPFARMKTKEKHPTISRRDFLDYTKSVWTFNPESARRVGHPAPFPVELPRRLIRLYTFAADVVLDPFIGTGATALAAVEERRHFVGYDINLEYCQRAEARIGNLRTQLGLDSTGAVTHPAVVALTCPLEFPRER